MNVHHLELFYYVAKHGGISRAARNMPYGIQQPAISGQILQLENDLGVKLFNRRPFELTASGQELYDYARGFFDGLDDVADRIRGGATQHLRLAASPIIIRDYLPGIFRKLQEKFPRLKLGLYEGLQPQVEELFESQAIDIAFTALESKLPAGVQSRVLVELPLVLLVPTSLTKLKSAEDILSQDHIEHTQISLPPNEALSRAFQRCFNKRGLDWPIGIEVHSIEMIYTYAASGLGIGLAAALPNHKAPKGVKILPMENVAPIQIGAFWRGKLTRIQEVLLSEMEEIASGMK